MYNKTVNEITLQLTRYEVLMAEKSYDISKLLDFYGDMLSDRQRLAVELYYNDDLSLSEIADEMNISRQGVRASLKKSEDILRGMEEKLGFAERFRKTFSRCEALRKFAEKTLLESEQSGDKALEGFARQIVSFAKKIEQDID